MGFGHFSCDAFKELHEVSDLLSFLRGRPNFLCKRGVPIVALFQEFEALANHFIGGLLASAADLLLDQALSLGTQRKLHRAPSPLAYQIRIALAI